MKVLILVDLEKEWIQENSEYYIGNNLENLIKKTNQLIKFARHKNYKIIFIRHIEDSGSAFIKNATGVEFFEDIDIKESDIIIEKHRISPFYKTNLENILENSKNVIVSGMLTNLCVRSLVNDAYDRDYSIELVEDCCIAFDNEIHVFTLQDIKETRPEVKIKTLDELIKNENEN